MTKQHHIELGEKKFAVHPLNLGEIEELSDALDSMGASGATGRQRFAAMRAVIALVLRRDTPDITDDQIKAIEVTAPQLRAAVDTILTVSGFKAATPGEGEAGTVAA